MSEQTGSAITDEAPNGAFYNSLIRNNSQIKKDRAAAIHEAAQLIYRRRIEDTELAIKHIKRKREAALDLSPDNALSLKPANKFSEEEFVNDDIKMGIDLRNLEIKLEIMRERYKYLFGE